MKSKIAVLFLIVLLCLTSGCSNTSQIAEQPAPVSSSESNKAPYQSETAQATEKTEVEQPRSTEPKDDDRSTEATVGVLDSSIQTKPASEQPNSGTTPPQVSEPSKTPDESERHPEVSAPSEKEQPTPPATEEPNRQRNHNRPNLRRKNQQSQHLTLAIGSALPRAMPRVSVLR